MLEINARGGMRVGEVLNLRVVDVDDQKLTIRNPKSGKSSEVVFIPKKIADRLKDYIKARGVEGDERIFPISYTAGQGHGQEGRRPGWGPFKAHDLRRHAATYASRSGVPWKLSAR